MNEGMKVLRRERIVLEIFLPPSISPQFAPLLKSFRRRAAGKLRRSRKLANASLIIGILATTVQLSKFLHR